jgi:hypothetical protein
MARSRDQRIKDALELLQTEVDVWIATAGGGGKPYLVPLSFYWSGDAMIVTTTHSSQTGRNFAGAGGACAAIGQTRGQVAVIDARVEEMPVGENVELENAYVRAIDFDPRPWMSATPSSASFPSGSRRGEAMTPRNFATKI